MPASDEAVPGFALAVTAEALYLTNLLILPGLGFLLLFGIWWRYRASAPPLAAAHLSQTLAASLWAGALLIIVNVLILLLGGYQGHQTWIIVITYFTICHSLLVICGAYGLAKAMASQCWRYPLLGPPLPSNCPGIR